jgi:hypothetical protein
VARYHVCVDGDQDVINEARTKEAESPQEAAEEYVRLNFANLDYPEETEVWVKQAGVAVLPVKYSVATIREVRFSAKSVQ